MRPPDRIFRVLLRFYPAEFRDEYAREMARVLRGLASSRRRDSGPMCSPI